MKNKANENRLKGNLTRITDNEQSGWYNLSKNKPGGSKVNSSCKGDIGSC